MSDHLTPADRALCEALGGYGIEEETLDRAKQRIRELSTRYAKLEALADKLAEALENCADDLGSEVKARTEHLRGYPTYERKRQADLEPVTKALEALAAYNLHKIDG